MARSPIPDLTPPDPPEETYEYVVATVDCGELNWRYKLRGKPEGRMAHDEDVSEWSLTDIEHLTREMLDIPEGTPVKVEYA